MRPPGLGALTAFASINFSSVSARMLSVSPPGRARPGGGIMPARNLPIIFSAVSGVSGALATLKFCSVKLPAVPLRVSLWQPAQFFLTTAVSISASAAEILATPYPGTRLLITSWRP